MDLPRARTMRIEDQAGRPWRGDGPPYTVLEMGEGMRARFDASGRVRLAVLECGRYREVFSIEDRDPSTAAKATECAKGGEGAKAAARALERRLASIFRGRDVREEGSDGLDAMEAIVWLMAPRKDPKAHFALLTSTPEKPAMFRNVGCPMDPGAAAATQAAFRHFSRNGALDGWTLTHKGLGHPDRHRAYAIEAQHVRIGVGEGPTSHRRMALLAAMDKRLHRLACEGPGMEWAAEVRLRILREAGM